ncbi:MAG TPA: cupin domain-containing protein [Steroidobacteraceae bacterium]|nr:cupin domain-containing protein [Steroidobacteraceae bacterium]
MNTTARVVAILAVLPLLGAGVAGASAAEPAASTPASTSVSTSVSMIAVPPVRYFARPDVEATFNHQRKSESLFDSNYGSESFRVKASSRTKVLDAEIHLEWTDVIYVTKGSATLVTGGRLSNDTTPKTFPDGTPFTETKMGSSIIGGESRRVSVGDVVVIPAGTPHWFKDIDGPFWFFNVKTR